MRNKNGFTLIELLAVIVVLAIIMVIATTQINNIIKKSRGEAFYESVQSIRKSLQTKCVTDGVIKRNDWKNFDSEDLEFGFHQREGKYINKFSVHPKRGGKFDNMILPDYDKEIYTKSTFSNSEWKVYGFTFELDCDVVE